MAYLSVLNYHLFLVFNMATLTSAFDVQQAGYWTIDTTSFFSATPSANINSLCVYPSTLSSTFQTCNGGNEGFFNASSGIISCILSSPNAGNTNGLPFTDSWEYSWDSLDRLDSKLRVYSYFPFFVRPAATWAVAQSTCMSLGARLPYPTELWKILPSNPYSESSPTNISSNPLWTASFYSSGNVVTLNLATALTSFAAQATALNFRCVWPPTPIGNLVCF